jgi:hypothetical protein
LLSHRRPVCQPQAAVPRSALPGLSWARLAAGLDCRA